MSEYLDLYVDDRLVLSIRNPMDLSFFEAFSRGEFQIVERNDGERRHLHLGHDEETTRTPELAAEISIIRDRLSALGVGLEAISTEFERQRIASKASYTSAVAGLGSDKVEARHGMNFESWLGWARQEYLADSRQEPDELNIDPDGVWEFASSMCWLRALVEVAQEGHLVVDLYEVLPDWGYEAADEIAGWTPLDFLGVTNGPIVLTEGSTDAAVLQTALAVVAPHLVSYVRFFDFDYRPPGGAAALASLLRSFAAAGISNHMIAIFDNDTAGIEHMDTLLTAALPGHMRVIRLPDLPLATAYPTIGPSGDEVMDINGKACSIELYLGRDVLENEDRALTPVQWTGFNRRLGQFQGEIQNKRDLVDRFEKKAIIAKQLESIPDDQDWSGMTLVFDAVLAELSRIP